MQVLQLRMLQLLKPSNSALQPPLHRQQQQQQQVTPCIPPAYNDYMSGTLSAWREAQGHSETVQARALHPGGDDQQLQQQQQQRLGPDSYWQLWYGFSAPDRPAWGLEPGRELFVAQEQLEDLSRACQLGELQLLYDAR
jgi:hypothetical protein